MKLIFVLGVVSVLMLTGCAARSVGAFRTVISPNCLTAPVVMKNCSASGSSTRSREVEVRYKPGCAQIEVKKSDQTPAK
jgi:hypothetical protein